MRFLFVSVWFRYAVAQYSASAALISCVVACEYGVKQASKIVLLCLRVGSSVSNNPVHIAPIVAKETIFGFRLLHNRLLPLSKTFSFIVSQY